MIVHGQELSYNHFNKHNTEVSFMCEKFTTPTMREVMTPHVTNKQHKCNEESYWESLRVQKEADTKKLGSLIFSPKWPTFEDNKYAHAKLINEAEDLADVLIKNDIPFKGIGVAASMKKSDTPEFVIYMSRGTRSLIFAQDIPELFHGVEVVTRVIKK